MLYFSNTNTNILCMINTLGNLFSYINNKPHAGCINNTISEYKTDPEWDSKIDNPPIVETMQRINSYNKLDPTPIVYNKFDSSPIIYNKLLYHQPVNEYKCCNCYKIVNIQSSGSYHAMDKMWCYLCWIKKPWEYQSP